MSILRDLASMFGIPLLPEGSKADTRVYKFSPNARAKVTNVLGARGYTVRTFGTDKADTLKPDFKATGYHTGDLWIFDPSTGNGALTWDAEYTWVWRASHEYGHAVTLEEINRRHGEGRRAGKLGSPLTLEECYRALEWELLAFKAQWEFLLGADYAVAIENRVSDYWRESCINLLDAVYRCITGEFSDPATEGIAVKNWIAPLHPTDVYWKLRAILLGASFNAKG